MFLRNDLFSVLSRNQLFDV